MMKLRKNTFLTPVNKMKLYHDDTIDDWVIDNSNDQNNIKRRSKKMSLIPP